MSKRTKKNRSHAAHSGARIRASGIPLSSGTRGSELHDWLSGGLSSSGMAVTERTAMQLSVVNACTALIGGAIASMPLHVYERIDDDERKRIKNDLWFMLNESAMPNWLACTFWESLLLAKLLHGDGFARIHRTSRLSPNIYGFEPINPAKMQRIDLDKNMLIYTYVSSDGKIITADQGDMLHFPSMGFDGRRSPSALRYGLFNAAGTALAANEYSARFFRNSARPDYWITTTTDLGDEAIAEIKSVVEQKYGGAMNAHRPGLLQGEFKIEQVTMPHEDAQLLQTRGFQIEEIARAFNVPPFLIGHNEKTTSFGRGLEELGRAFVQYTLLRHMNTIRQEINRKVFGRSDRFYVEHNTAALERGDLKTRFEAYRIAIGRAGEPGWMEPNEARRLENMRPHENGNGLNSGVKKNGKATA
ncbi:MAG: phage portal protein [Nitrosomonas sp.]|nr:phage portal protein [Nitrosomonas sp.]